MAIKTDMLRYFVEVAEVGNLASAAKVLQRSPAAISMMLKHLEEELDAPLFETDRKNQLTALGEYTLEVAKKELNHFEGSISSIMHFAESGEGKVHIAVIPAAAANLMPHVVNALHDENSNILVEIEDLNNESVIANVSAEAVDIGIVNDLKISGKPNFKHAKILTDRIGLLCARDSELGRKEKLYWSDVANTQMITHFLCKMIDEPAVRKAISTSRLRIACAISIQSFVRSGEYISPLPELGAKSLPSDLVFRIPEGNAYWRNIYLVWNDYRKPTPATIRFCNILQRVIADMGMAPTEKEGDEFPTENGNGK